MNLHPWTILSWPAVKISTERTPAFVRTLRHLGTVVSNDCDEYGRLRGQTFWGTAAQQFGIAWDWTEVWDGVFALSDPMALVSNIRLVDETGETVLDNFILMELNRVVYRLPWQSKVSLATRHPRAQAPWSERVTTRHLQPARMARPRARPHIEEPPVRLAA